jgi:co-chaperonin GroES (HSP10)
LAAFTVGVADLPNEWDTKPKVGQTVILDRYAGISVEGKDKEQYRLINDKQILAILTE